MTEEQLMFRRALQEALDRRDNGGPPPASLRRSESGDVVAESSRSIEEAGVIDESGVSGSSAPGSELDRAMPGEAESDDAEPRLGVPFPRVAA